VVRATEKVKLVGSEDVAWAMCVATSTNESEENQVILFGDFKITVGANDIDGDFA
jgi:hypothetical protein